MDVLKKSKRHIIWNGGSSQFQVSSPMFQIDYNAAAKIKEFHSVHRKKNPEKHQNG
jgi:hypothetical protein